MNYLLRNSKNIHFFHMEVSEVETHHLFNVLVKF